MKYAISAFLILAACLALAQEPRRGYVLKVGEGEVLADAIIKASPKSGTQGGVMILQTMPENFSTGLHIHLHADEFFYIVSGTGTATLGDETYAIEAGDVIFAPAGLKHRIRSEGEELVVLEFLDKPGLDEEFRAWHREYSENGQSVTLEQINAIANKYGTVYKTID
jgi:mannose-6-phosphate isomerase-like protein (cupin superfamily)